MAIPNWIIHAAFLAALAALAAVTYFGLSLNF